MGDLLATICQRHVQVTDGVTPQVSVCRVYEVLSTSRTALVVMYGILVRDEEIECWLWIGWTERRALIGAFGQAGT